MRPIVLITVGYITGIIWGLYFKSSIVPIFFVFGGIIFLYSRKNHKIFYYILAFLIFAFISNAQIRYLEKKHENLYNDIGEIEVIGTVISEKKETNYKSSYEIKVESVNDNEKYKSTCLLIYVNKSENLEYGDKIILYGDYEEAQEATNYKVFDYREYLKQKNIYGIVNVKQVKVLKQDNLNKAMIVLNNLRSNIKANLKEILGEKSGIAIGILLR